MVKVYTAQVRHDRLIGHSGVDMGAACIELVNKQDFDRAISLLKLQGAALKHEAGVKAVQLPAEHDQNYPADKSDLDAIKAIVKQTEEFLEECK